MRRPILPAALLLVLLIAGCGGGKSAAPPLPATPAGGTGTVVFTLTIPPRRPVSRGRTPSYVSAATNSLTVRVNGGAVQTFNAVGPTIQATVDAPVGSDTFVLDQYQNPGGTGAHLATATQTIVITGSGVQSPAVTMQGIVQAATVSLVTPVVDGAAGTAQVGIAATDAASQPITGPFSTTFTFTSGSPHATIAGSVGSSSQAATLTYDGTCLAGTFTVSGSDGTVTGSATVGSRWQTVTSNSDSGPGTLRAILTAPQAGDAAVFTSGTTVTLASALPSIANTVSACATGATPVIDGGGSNAIFSVLGTGTLAIKNLTFQHSPNALTLQTGAAATVSSATFTSNSGGNAGEAIAVGTNATLSVSSTLFNSNSNASGGGYGGAVDVNSGATVSMTDATFSNNTLTGSASGAALSLHGGTITLTRPAFGNNTAPLAGMSAGAIGGTATSLTITNGNFNLNTAYANAGTLRLDGGTFTITATAFQNGGTTLPSVGGALLLNVASSGSITSSLFAGNSTDQGGAIYARGPLTVTNSVFVGNSASNQGGAIYLDTAGTLALNFDTFISNAATTAAADLFINGGTASATGTIFANGTGGSSPQINGVLAAGDYDYFTSTSGVTPSGTHNLVATPLTFTTVSLDGYGVNALPQAGSSVIGVVPSAACALVVDARGSLRPNAVPGFCSIGALEP